MKAVVIGSGPNGLAGAIALARAGLEVEVHEAEPEIGGGLRSAELTLPGFVHDVCSAIHPLAVASPFFRELELNVEWVESPAALAHPFDDASETHVAFLATRPAKAAAARLQAVDPGADLAVLSGAEVYLRLPRGVHGSRLSIARIETLLGVPATLRNWRTVVALAELASGA